MPSSNPGVPSSLAGPPPLPTSPPVMAGGPGGWPGVDAPAGSAEENVPIRGVPRTIEATLRQPGRMMRQLGQPGSGALVATLVAITVVCSLVYGFVAGTFSGGVQLWAAPVKIMTGLLLSTLICLPSLYIFSCLSRSRGGLLEVAGLVAGFLALMTVLLVGFAPVAWVFSQSTNSVAAMGALHLLFWTVATAFGWRFLRQGFMHLQAESAAGLRVWMAIFLLVAVQMTTALRPIIGSADTLLPGEKKFFINHWVECLDSPKPR